METTTTNITQTVLPTNSSGADDDGDDGQSYSEEFVSNLLWKILPPLIFVIGLTGNILNIAVIRRLGVSRQPTLVFLCFLAVVDSFVLTVGLSRYWILYVFDFDLRTISNLGCKFSLFFIYVSMQYSSWILVSVTVERVVKTYFPFLYRRMYTVKRVAVSLCIILFLCCIIDMHFYWTNGINQYTEGDCSSLTPKDFHFDEDVFTYIDFAFLSAIPFVIMLVCNVFIVRALKRIQLNRASMMHGSVWKRTQRVSVKMTKMLVVSTFYFIIATAPICIYFILDSYLSPKYEEENNGSATAKMDLVWTVTYLLQFSNYAANFFLYTFVNDRFKSELKNLLRCRSRTERARMSVYALNGFKRRPHRVKDKSSTSSTSMELDVAEEPQSIGIESFHSSEENNEESIVTERARMSVYALNGFKRRPHRVKDKSSTSSTSVELDVAEEPQSIGIESFHSSEENNEESIV